MSNVFNEGDPVVVVDLQPMMSMSRQAQDYLIGKTGRVTGYIPDMSYGVEVVFDDHDNRLDTPFYFRVDELEIDESRILPIPGSVFWPGQVVEVVDICEADDEMLEYLGLQGVIVRAAGSPSSPGRSPILDSVYDVYVKFGDDMGAFYDAELDLVEEAL